MTAYRFVTLTCDRCGEIWDIETVFSVKEARAGALASCWTYKNRQDFCPACSGTHIRSDLGYYIRKK